MFFSLDQQPYSLQLHPSDSQVYIEFAVFLNTISNNRAPLQCTKHFLRFIDEYLWGQLTFTVPWKNFKVQNLIDWHLKNLQTEVLLRRVWKILSKNTYLKRWLHYHLPLFASLYPYDLAPVAFIVYCSVLLWTTNSFNSKCNFDASALHIHVSKNSDSSF